MHDIYGTIRRNIALFYQPIQMAGGYTFDHVTTLKRINLYWAGKFESGDRDSQGMKKFFYNISKPACDIATKFVDLDTKDILLTSERAGDEYKVFVMQRDLKHFLKKKKFGTLLNSIASDYPKYGSVVVKRHSDGLWSKVNLENLRVDPAAECLEKMPFLYEAHVMTRREIAEMSWDASAVETLLRNNGEDQTIVVYECYHPNLTGEGKAWQRYFCGDFLRDRKTGLRTAEAQLNLKRDFHPGVMLHCDEVDELPYQELHWERIPGRWLGFGFVEYLFDNQVRVNELVNVKAKGLYLTSLKVYQTSDENVPRNLLTDVENGEVIRSSSGIAPVAMEDRNLSYFGVEEARWDMNTERKTFTTDVTRGEELPSGTPLGAARLAAGMVASYFDIKRENFGLFLKDLILERVLPAFEKESMKEHLLKFFGSDKEIAKLRKAFVEFNLRKSIMDYAVKSGVIPSTLQLDLERQRLELQSQKRKDILLKVPDGFYADVEYTVDVNVTGEQLDVASRLQTLQFALQTMAANPAIVQEPALRTVFFKMLELAGVSPVEIDLLEERVQEQGNGMMGMMESSGGQPAKPMAPPAAPGVMAPTQAAV